ncbi:hypothetical protein HWV07_07515 [Natronomonas salina]|uniref:HTH domain-containing protein n=1 Tax=Natronomonas salina TaxID=1710540 RepID=UPI0015B6EE6E|nr:HTH domain-containing protein [Natronomonas salina]QLD88885.1 hypothetical protein HWV07_07515 [Natronomonas salina]
MLRGIDARGAADDEPTIIRVADRDPVDAEVTVFLDANASGAAADRQDDVTAEFERLEAAGVIDAPSVVTWQDADVGARFNEFRDAVGGGSLDPFFEELADGNALDVPHVCIALRSDGSLTGLYPRTADGDEQTVEDCLRALRTGDHAENVEYGPDRSVKSVDVRDDESATAEIEQSSDAAKAD